MTWTMNIPGWAPTPLNKLLTNWRARARAKRKDKEIMANAKLAFGVPDAESKRRIDLLIIHPKGKRFCDPDSYSKSMLDSMVSCGLLKNDSHLWVEMDRPEFARGTVLRTIITLTDI